MTLSVKNIPTYLKSSIKGRAACEAPLDLADRINPNVPTPQYLVHGFLRDDYLRSK